VALDPERHVVRCAHCGAANLVAGRLTRPVARFRPVLGPRELEDAVRRFALSRDVRAAPGVAAAREIWVPYWIPAAPGAGREVRAAVEVDDPVIARIDEPRGETEPIDAAAAEADESWAWPTAPGGEGEVLRYVPFFRVRLQAGGVELDAFVDRVDGRVLASTPLNPGRLRLTGALGGLLLAYAAIDVGLGVAAPHPLLAVAGAAALGLALWWPLWRIAVAPRLPPAPGERPP
jgi:hypothetical protein